MRIDCLTAEKQINCFLKGEMDNRTATRFLRHIEECSSCREELSIQFLVSVGLERLEDGEAFNLNQELTNRLETAQWQVKMRRRVQGSLYIYETAAIFAAILIIVLVVL